MKKIVLIAICLAMLLSLAACGKPVLSSDEFKAAAAANGCTPEDITGQYSDYSYVEQVIVARNSAGWQVEFYVLDSADTAAALFGNNRAEIEASKGAVSSNASVTMGDYSSFSQTGSGTYSRVIKSGSTMLYAQVPKEYKEAVTGFFKALGY